MSILKVLDRAYVCAIGGAARSEVLEASRDIVELFAAIEQYKSDFRTEGCAKKDCIVCKRSNTAKDRLDAALKRVHP